MTISEVINSLSSTGNRLTANLFDLTFSQQSAILRYLLTVNIYAVIMLEHL